MQSQSRWPLVFGLSLVAMVVFMSIRSWQIDEEKKVADLERMDRSALINFASGFQANEVKTTAFELGSSNPFHLPSATATVFATDPVVSHASTQRDIVPVSTDSNCALEAEFFEEIPDEQLANNEFNVLNSTWTVQEVDYEVDIQLVGNLRRFPC